MIARRERHRRGIPRANAPDSDWIGIIGALALLAGWAVFLQALSTRDISVYPREQYYEPTPSDPIIASRPSQSSVSSARHNPGDKYITRINAEGHKITVSLVTGEIISVSVKKGTGSTASHHVKQTKEGSVESTTDLSGGTTRDETTTLKNEDKADGSTTGSGSDQIPPGSTTSTQGSQSGGHTTEMDQNTTGPQEDVPTTVPMETSSVPTAATMPSSGSTESAVQTGATLASSMLTSVFSEVAQSTVTTRSVTGAGTTAASTRTSTLSSDQSSSSSSPQTTQGHATPSTGSSASSGMTPIDTDTTDTVSSLKGTTRTAGTTSGNTESSEGRTTTMASTTSVSPTTTTDEIGILGYLIIDGDKIRIPMTGIMGIQVKFPAGSKVSLTVLAGCRITMAWSYEGGKEDMILYENRYNSVDSVNQIVKYTGFNSAFGRRV